MKFPKNDTNQNPVEKTVKVDLLADTLEKAERQAARERAENIAWHILSPVFFMAVGFAGCLYLVYLANS